MIEIEHLTRTFGTLTAVRDLCLTVPRGEIFCFLGPNGAGKTTTIKILCGLLRPTAGTVRVAGVDLRADPVAARKMTGYIPDQPYLYERLSVREYADFVADLFLLPAAERDARRQQYFDLFGLAEHEAALIKDLSHGMRQRLCYAATLLHSPKVLFVDEPFTGLDPHSIRTIRSTLREKARAGMTVFLTTHILALAADWADRVGILRQGQLVACDRVEELTRQHAADGTLEEVYLKLTAEPSRTVPATG